MGEGAPLVAPLACQLDCYVNNLMHPNVDVDEDILRCIRKN